MGQPKNSHGTGSVLPNQSSFPLHLVHFSTLPIIAGSHYSQAAALQNSSFLLALGKRNYSLRRKDCAPYDAPNLIHRHLSQALTPAPYPTTISESDSGDR